MLNLEMYFIAQYLTVKKQYIVSITLMFVCFVFIFYSVNQIKYNTILSYKKKKYKRERLKRYR